MINEVQKIKIKELINKANFLKESIDETTLTGNIEQELAKITGFVAESFFKDNNVVTWHYAITGYNVWGNSSTNRLQALISQLEHLVK